MVIPNCLSLIISSGISKSIKSIESNIVLLKEGDLTSDFKIKSKDDIGRLSNNLSHFLNILISVISEIKNFSLKNIKINETEKKLKTITNKHTLCQEN